MTRTDWESLTPNTIVRVGDRLMRFYRINENAGCVDAWDVQRGIQRSLKPDTPFRLVTGAVRAAGRRARERP